MINSYWYDPSPNKIEMYNWSPFCVAAHIYQTQLADEKLQGSTDCRMNHIQSRR